MLVVSWSSVLGDVGFEIQDVRLTASYSWKRLASLQNQLVLRALDVDSLSPGWKDNKLFDIQ